MDELTSLQPEVPETLVEASLPSSKLRAQSNPQLSACFQAQEGFSAFREGISAKLALAIIVKLNLFCSPLDFSLLPSCK